jgi:hypothetical protein
MATGCFRVKGTKIVGGEGNPVILKGAAVDGYLNMENFVTGYPSHDHQHNPRYGWQGKIPFLLKKFYEYFWKGRVAEFFASWLESAVELQANLKFSRD